MKLIRIVDGEKAYIFNRLKTRRQVGENVFIYPLVSFSLLVITIILIPAEITNAFVAIVVLFVLAAFPLSIVFSLLNLVAYFKMRYYKNKSYSNSMNFIDVEQEPAITEKPKVEVFPIKKNIEDINVGEMERVEMIGNDQYDKVIDFDIPDIIARIKEAYKTDIYPKEACVHDEVYSLFYLGKDYRYFSQDKVNEGDELRLHLGPNERIEVYQYNNGTIGELGKRDTKKIEKFVDNTRSYITKTILYKKEKENYSSDYSDIQVRISVYDISKYKRIVEQEKEDLICERVVEYLYRNKAVSGVFEIETDENQTTLLYKDEPMIQIRISEMRSWIKLNNSGEIRKKTDSNIKNEKKSPNNPKMLSIDLKRYDPKELLHEIEECFEQLERE